MGMNNDSIKSWNKDNGYGFSRGGAMVHVSVLGCEHLAPRNRKGYTARNLDVPVGTVVMLETERTDRGLRATSALCEACGAPGVWRQDVRPGYTHPITGVRVDFVEYVHVSGPRRDKPEADNSAYDACAAVWRRWQSNQELHEAEFGPARFVRIEDDRAVLTHGSSTTERLFDVEALRRMRPDWFVFVRVDEGTDKIDVVFAVPNGHEYRVQIGSTRRALDGSTWWNDECYRVLVPANPALEALLAPIRARMRDFSSHAARFLDAHREELTPILERYRAAMTALAAPNGVRLDTREGEWQEYVSDDMGYVHDFDSGDYVTKTGTIYTWSCDGAEVEPVVCHGRCDVTEAGVRADFERAVKEPLVQFTKERFGDGWPYLLGALVGAS